LQNYVRNLSYYTKEHETEQQTPKFQKLF